MLKAIAYFQHRILPASMSSTPCNVANYINLQIILVVGLDLSVGLSDDTACFGRRSKNSAKS